MATHGARIGYRREGAPVDLVLRVQAEVLHMKSVGGSAETDGGETLRIRRVHSSREYGSVCSPLVEGPGRIEHSARPPNGFACTPAALAIATGRLSKKPLKFGAS